MIVILEVLCLGLQREAEAPGTAAFTSRAAVSF